jgi:hypothetical protein
LSHTLARSRQEIITNTGQGIRPLKLARGSPFGHNFSKTKKWCAEVKTMRNVHYLASSSVHQSKVIDEGLATTIAEETAF